MAHIDDLLKVTVENRASDLHLKAGGVPAVRIDGELIPKNEMPVMSAGDINQVFAEMTTEEQRQLFIQNLELDFAYQADGLGRFRVNAYLQTGTISLACRPVRTDIPDIEDLELPGVCKDLVLKRSGLIIVTGPTGCGKSTTLAAMINYLNQKERRKMVTVEDPIEFMHQDGRCIFSQRALGKDTRSFASALKHALREDPDVILVGEMRDLETMAITLTAAETGHLVLTTLHSPGAPQAIDRFIDVFPPHQQQQVRIQLSTSLEGVIYQTLVPRIEGSGRAAALEIMLASPAVRNLIRENKTYQIINAIQAGLQCGMQSLNQALLNLCRGGLISREEAMARSADTGELKGMLESLR